MKYAGRVLTGQLSDYTVFIQSCQVTLAHDDEKWETEHKDWKTIQLQHLIILFARKGGTASRCI